MPLEKCMQKHKLREIYNCYLLFKIADASLQVTSRVYLVRQGYFKKENSIDKKDPMPRHVRTRKANVKLFEILEMICI